MYNVYRVDKIGRLNYIGCLTPDQIFSRLEPACRPAFSYDDDLFDIIIFPIPRTF